ncbi:MAG: hypothetical protein A2Y15_06175 [Clostridiales bacterium GWF2_36_10]|nr:MAG: hypothetical protein A2Y15_06175 [Clostridiales bacterium GWF2_36_10]HAN21897.1 hypothetical protein [Clostridiales bacterium]
MKRLLVIVFTIIFFLCLCCSCENPKNTSDTSDDEKSITWQFYNSFNPYNMYITFETTASDGSMARFAQAIKNKNITTIIDYLDNQTTNDIYRLYIDGTNYSLDTLNKQYSTSDEKGTENLFIGFNNSVYERADIVSDKELDGTIYICEVFGTDTDATRFYYEKDTHKIHLIEFVKNRKIIQSINNIVLTNIIPDYIILEVPEDYTKTSITLNNEIEWPDGWNE